MRMNGPVLTNQRRGRALSYERSVCARRRRPLASHVYARRITMEPRFRFPVKVSAWPSAPRCSLWTSSSTDGHPGKHFCIAERKQP
jgi:hypothetical protein